MFQGLRTVIYHVSDLKKAKEWYSKVLKAKPYFDQPFYVGFSVGGFELGLDPDREGITPGSSVVAYWGVPDAKAAFKRLLELGCRSTAPSRKSGTGSASARSRTRSGTSSGSSRTRTSPSRMCGDGAAGLMLI